MKLKLIEKFHESLHSMSIRGHYIKHIDLQKRVLLLRDRIEAIEKKQAERFPHLIERIEQLESNVKALKMEQDILYVKQKNR